MTLTTHECISAIERHSTGLGDAARHGLQAPVRHCPGWSVADLVWHVTGVQWFWATIADERLSGAPDDSRRPGRPADDALLDTFEAGVQHLAEVLRNADQSAGCWTWAPQQQDVAFVTRHQVQEAAVHHWDAADAIGGSAMIEPPVAADSVEEFLTFSVSSEADPAEPAKPGLTGSFVLRPTDTDTAWLVTDARTPGTVTFEPIRPPEPGGPGQPSAARTSADGVGAIEATASDLLLWLYQRVELDTSGVPTEVVHRFRELTFTD